MREVTVLVHGLWLNRLSLATWCRELRRAGMDARLFAYPSLRGTLAENAARLARFIAAIDAERVNLVGHSMGGLVILEMLRLHPDPRVRRTVLAGSPYAGCHVADVFRRRWLGRTILGRCMMQCVGRAMPAPPETVELGVLAGCRSIGLGTVLSSLPTPNDGTVALQETQVPGCRDSVVLKVNHTEMLVSREVVHQIAYFLRHGSFDRSR